MASKVRQRPDSSSTAPVSGATAAGPSVGEHLIHGLIAITDGPDYCLCGTTWPCPRREDRDAQP